MPAAWLKDTGKKTNAKAKHSLAAGAAFGDFLFMRPFCTLSNPKNVT
jgi:hypothetical protein